MHSLLLVSVASPAPFAALLPLGEAQFQAVVFCALGFTWVALALMYFKRQRAVDSEVVNPPPMSRPERIESPVHASPVSVVAPTVASKRAIAAVEVEDELTPELVAVIAAAVQLTLRDAYRIHAIVPVAVHDWAHEGRRQIFASHQIR